MTRILPMNAADADPRTTAFLDAVQKKMGTVPNMIATMAKSPAVGEAFLAMSQSLAGGALPARLREQLALRIAEANECGYCLAAHTALAKGVGITDAEARAARTGSSDDDKERAALAFASRIVEGRGRITDADVERVRAAGFTDGEVAEIIAHVALNTFTNYFNLVAATEVDFPAAPDLVAITP